MHLVGDLFELRDFSLLKLVRTGSGTYSASCSIGTRFLYYGQRAWFWPITSLSCRG